MYRKEVNLQSYTGTLGKTKSKLSQQDSNLPPSDSSKLVQLCSGHQKLILDFSLSDPGTLLWSALACKQTLHLGYSKRFALKGVWSKLRGWGEREKGYPAMVFVLF